MIGGDRLGQMGVHRLLWSSSLLFLLLLDYSMSLRAPPPPTTATWRCYGYFSDRINTANAGKRSSATELYSSMRGARKYIPPLLEERLREGKVKASELDRCFPLSERDVEDITKETSLEFFGSGNDNVKKFNAGIIFSLESALCEVSHLYQNAFIQLVPDLRLLGLAQPSSATIANKLTPVNICDSIGSDIKDCMLALYDVEDELSELSNPVVLNAAEIKLHSIFRSLAESMPRGSRIATKPGAEYLLSTAIDEGNDIIISTRLPRAVALKVLQLAGLTDLLKGRIDPSRLMVVNDFGETNFDRDPAGMSRSLLMQKVNQGRYSIEQHIMKCCYMLQKNTVKTVYIDGNRRNVLRAKRLGVTVVAIRGDAINPTDMKVADKLVDSLDTIRMKDIYKLIKHAVISAQGPGQQTQSAAIRMRPRKVMGLSADLYVNDGERDTFGDEFGSDLF